MQYIQIAKQSNNTQLNTERNTQIIFSSLIFLKYDVKF